MSDDRRWDLYVGDMIEACERVVSYTAGMDQTAFLGDTLTYDAALRNLMIVGEAATHVPKSVRVAHPDIPWRDIVATRNRLIHAYLGIDDDLIWVIVHRSVPDLIPHLLVLREEAERQDSADAP